MTFDQLAGQLTVQIIALAAAGAHGLPEAGQAFGMDDIELPERILPQDGQQGREAGFQAEGHRALLEALAQVLEPGGQFFRPMGQANPFSLALGAFQQEIVMLVGPVPSDPGGHGRLIIHNI